jgi:hypothetical protein
VIRTEKAFVTKEKQFSAAGMGKPKPASAFVLFSPLLCFVDYTITFFIKPDTCCKVYYTFIHRLERDVKRESGEVL